mgnify:FL=1
MAKKDTNQKDVNILEGIMKMKENMSNNETAYFVLGIILLLFAGYLLLAFISFFFTGAADQSVLEGSTSAELAQTGNDIQNVGGARGALLSNFLINDCFGLASVFVIAFFAVLGMRLMKVHDFKIRKWFLRCFFLLIWFSLFFGFFFEGFYEDSFIYLGGLHGYNVSKWLGSQIGTPGVLFLLLGTGIAFLATVNKKVIDWFRTLFKFPFLKRAKSVKRSKEETVVEDSSEGEMQATTNNEESIAVNEEDKEGHVVDLGVVVSGTDLVEEAKDKVLEADRESASANSVEKNDRETELSKEPDFQVETAAKDEVYQQLNSSEPYNPKLDLENYKLPPLDLMKHYENNDPTINMDEQQTNKEKIIATLSSFGIEIRTIKATVGPTVTLYEITPEQGVRISKIRGLEDDIALSLAALGIRIIAPIPGKGTIGIEVPNSDPKIVSGQSIIGSKAFQTTKFELPVAFGKTITNEVFMVDLCKMPHVLVAGATGQGKSVGLNTMITSLLYKKHPAELKFVLIDPKKVEFSIYSVIENHFLAKLPDGGEPIITDVTKVVETLNSICVEMDSRYDLLKMAQVRNIREYNDKFINRRLNPEKGHKFMPYIVVIIDEFGDLIMTAGKDIELPIARIAQLARAVGIHMVIATQRPTTNIITGTIKANFPARVAFKVSSMMDSRTILDRPGANQLIGRGDMLFLHGNNPVRVQCAFIDTPEVEEITRYIARQQGYTSAFLLPEYTSEEMDAAMGNVDPAKLDPLFKDAATLIVLHQQGSTSLIQRKFSIGYNRAGRIIDQLEAMGIVGPSEGSKARQVLCADELELERKLNI